MVEKVQNVLVIDRFHVEWERGFVQNCMDSHQSTLYGILYPTMHFDVMNDAVYMNKHTKGCSLAPTCSRSWSVWTKPPVRVEFLRT